MFTATAIFAISNIAASAVGYLYRSPFLAVATALGVAVLGAALAAEGML